MENSDIWNVIGKYFEENPQALVRHHIESYNDFFEKGIFQIFKEKNPITIQTRFDEKIDDYRSKCIMYFGGKKTDKIYFGKPVIYDDDNSHFMFPNEARLRDMTYGMTIHYDIDIEFIDILEEGEAPTLIGAEDYDLDSLQQDKKEITGGMENVPKRKGKYKKKDLELTPAELTTIKENTKKTLINENTQIRTITLEKIYLGKFPIMLQSHFCVLSGLPKEMRHTMGECVNDKGGYFIIEGLEKTVVPQEKFGDNMLYIKKMNEDDKFLLSAEIRSVSENVSKPIRTLGVKLVNDTKSYQHKNIVVSIPNVRSPVPLFILFRALGINSDKEIISTCLLNMDKYESMVDLFIPSVYDAGAILNQRNALKYIALLTKGKTIPHVLEILCDYFLPHVGENNYINKAYYLGYIVFRLLCVFTEKEEPTDRDNFKFKRIDLVGNSMYNLFREYYTIQLRTIHVEFEKRAHYNQSIYANNLQGLIFDNYKDIFREKIVESGFKKAFKGNWGAYPHTKQIGIVQDLNILSNNSKLSHLRKTNLPLDATAKVVGPRILHSTQWGLFDPIDTPDGGNIGLHKHFAIGCYVTQGYSRAPMIAWLREKVDMKLIEDCTPVIISTMTKVFVNGFWCGVLTEPEETVQKFLLFRRNALIPIYTSICFDKKLNTIFIYTDAGRVCRPIFYKDSETNTFPYQNKTIMESISKNEFSWFDLICGFNEKRDENFHPNHYKMYELGELYKNVNNEKNPAKLETFLSKKAIIDFIDTNETENSLIALNKDSLSKKLNYTHMEIHESLIFGVMSNLINFIENNPATRNSFSCGQSKQACSMYNTNYQNRMDKSAIILNYGQNPIVKTRYLEHINNEYAPYGENTIVAIMCYTGYNVEDAILVNEGALKRGLFRTTYFNTYHVHEEKTKNADVTNQKILLNIENDETVFRKKPGYDYSLLDKYGLIKENTEINDKTVLIGMASQSSDVADAKSDISKVPKKGQKGIVDKTFITDGEEGKRIAKVRIREERIPNIGDKMASRAGQKGTIGLVIPEADMPFSKSGIKPDLIINPHAIPSRMTIGQLVETITGKACAMYGSFGDCTAYNSSGSKIGIYGELLTKVGFHSSGNEILYDGMNGKQIETEIFMGPNYYMRLKHMVKDKINYRAMGPRTNLTKQPVSGRANDGGLRIGEMERDSVISHGATEFLRESMMERSDKYKLAICNNTGMTAIYNPTKNVFISPMVDGPIQFSGSLDNNNLHMDTMSKYGRNFSIVDVPYSLKLLMQELLSLNISLRIITEDNINQLETMNFSKNIDLLMNEKDTNIRTIVKNVQRILREEDKPLETPLSMDFENIIDETVGSPPYTVQSAESDESTIYNPYSPSESPPYIPISPENVTYMPTSPVDSPPLFLPRSPSTSPNIPQKQPQRGYKIDSYSSDDSEIPPPPPDNVAKPYFSIGMLVHFRGDSLPERLWEVINITPDDFITIKTDNSDGLDTLEMVKVVTPIDIYKQGDYPISSPYLDDLGNNPQNTDTKANLSNVPPAINFAPVITINNGDKKEEIETNAKENNSADEKIETAKTEDNIFPGAFSVKKI